MTATGFFAYPSTPKSISDSIQSAASDIARGGVANLMLWENMGISGKIVIDEICKSIDNCDFLCADLTGVNPNVLFEVGYAIGKGKRIWLTMDTSLSQAKHAFDELRILSTIGYQDYSNSKDIVTAFYKDEPYSSLKSTLFDTEIKPLQNNDTRQALLYLKSEVDTEASTKITNCLRSSHIPMTIDDPKESQSQSLIWYGQHLSNASGLISHFNSKDRTGALIRNAKQALVSGLAKGMGIPILMLAEQDYMAPLDYRDLVFSYQKAQQAVDKLTSWLPAIKEASQKIAQSRTEKRTEHSSNKGRIPLKELHLGDYLAENEDQRELDEYFLQTAEYREAVEGKNRIFVGRKGTGKTATFLKLAMHFKNDRNNVVCVIQPAGFEVQQIVLLLHRYSEQSQKQYVVESLWKFILYTEIANIVAADLESRKNIKHTQEEMEFLQMMETHGTMFREDFAIRLERVVGQLSARNLSQTLESTRFSISESLHKEILTKLRKQLGAVLNEKRFVRILIDNLDKAWTESQDLDNVSTVLFGLLSAVSKIQNELDETHSGLKRIPMSMALFLRADIFYRIAEKASEPDKLQSSKMLWNDEELLLRVVEERVQYDVDQGSNIWSEYFCSSIEGESTRKVLIDSILHRPRDIIFFVKSAIGNAIKHGREKVSEKDFLDAEKSYSHYAVDSLLAEDLSYSKGKGLKQLLYEFMGQDFILDHNKLVDILQKAEVATEDCAKIIEQLCKLSFIGLETSPNVFKYLEDPADYKRLDALAKNRGKGVRRYKINKAFHSYLNGE